MSTTSIIEYKLNENTEAQENTVRTQKAKAKVIEAEEVEKGVDRKKRKEIEKGIDKKNTSKEKDPGIKRKDMKEMMKDMKNDKSIMTVMTITRRKGTIRVGIVVNDPMKGKGKKTTKKANMKTPDIETTEVKKSIKA